MTRETGQAKAVAAVLRNIIIELAAAMPEADAKRFIDAIEIGTQRDLSGGSISTRTRAHDQEAVGASEITGMVFYALEVLARERASKR